jgi:tRNA threonylcarbamoyladenosine biosynthesis protein TsaB
MPISRVLALDTTSLPGSAALLRDGQIDLEMALETGRPFGECLPGALTDLLARASLRPDDVDLFVVGSGPGSLTGLRVGIATMQGLALATGRPLAGVSALDALGEAGLPPAGTGPAVVAAWMDARRGEVFAELFEVAPTGTRSSLDGPLVGAPAVVAAQWSPVVREARLVVIGNAAPGSLPLWPDHGLPVSLVPHPLLAGVMAKLGVRAAAAGLGGHPHALRPLYVRRPDAVVARERHQSGA